MASSVSVGFLGLCVFIPEGKMLSRLCSTGNRTAVPLLYAANTDPQMRQ